MKKLFFIIIFLISTNLYAEYKFLERYGDWELWSEYDEFDDEYRFNLRTFAITLSGQKTKNLLFIVCDEYDEERMKELNYERGFYNFYIFPEEKKFNEYLYKKYRNKDSPFIIGLRVKNEIYDWRDVIFSYDDEKEEVNFLFSRNMSGENSILYEIFKKSASRIVFDFYGTSIGFNTNNLRKIYVDVLKNSCGPI